MSISRRNFLVGTVAAVAGSELIVKAHASDILQFTTGKSVNVGEVQKLLANVQRRDYSSPLAPIAKGEVIHNKYGQPVGMILRVSFWTVDKGHTVTIQEKDLRKASEHYDVKEPIRMSAVSELIWTDDFSEGVADGVDHVGLPELLRRS